MPEGTLAINAQAATLALAMPYESLFDNDWDDFWPRCGNASPQSLSRLAVVIDQPTGIPQHGGVGCPGGPPFDLGLAPASITRQPKGQAF